MNCREAERLIDTFFDGELDGRSMRDAALHITRCKRCEAELSDRERVQKVLAAAIDGAIADVDLSRVWAAVEPAIDASRAKGRLAPFAALPGARALRSMRSATRFRLAAASSLPGLVPGEARDVDDEIDLSGGGWGARPREGSSLWRWSVAGGAALAASVIVAVALVPGGRDGGTPDAPRVTAGIARDLGQGVGQDASSDLAAAGSGATAPRLALSPARANPAGVAPFALARSGARAEAITGGRGAAKQVQVESVNFPRSSVAMWSEPASDTTVIWVEDEELQPGR